MIEFYVLLGIGALLLAFVLTWLNDKVNDPENLKGSAARRRRKIEQVRRNAPAESSEAIDARARELLAAGEKIEAIKFIREQTGLDLKDAKDYVERL
jgi:ribosomal protein L7/L12